MSGGLAWVAAGDRVKYNLDARDRGLDERSDDPYSG